MSRPPFLSPSAWSTWEQCQQRWRFRYILKQPDPGSVHTVSGNIVHLALDLLMSHEPEDRTATLRRLCFETAFEQMEPEIVKVGAPIDVVRRWVQDSADTFATTEPGTPSSARVLHTERRHRMEVADVPVLLIIDRIDLVPHKMKPTALPIDYKSGAKAKTSIGYTRQMVLSSMAAEQITGLPAPVAELRYVRVGEVRTVRTGKAAQETVAEDLRRAWRQITSACLEDDFTVNPSPLCAWCPYESQCPQGQRAARQYRERKGIA